MRGHHPETARWLGAWADGLATVHRPATELRAVLEAFREGGGEGKPALLQVHVSWAPTDDEARAIAYDQWRTNVLPPLVLWDLETPEHFEAAAVHVREEDVLRTVLTSSDLGRHRGWIEEGLAVGFDEVAVHHVGRQQAAFIEAYGGRVLPALA